MNENHEMNATNPIAVAQNFVTAQTSEELQEAMKAIHLSCLTQPVDAIREIAKHLEVVAKATLMDRVREDAKNGNCAENASVALEDAENLVNPVLPAPIFSQKACQLALDVKYLSCCVATAVSGCSCWTRFSISPVMRQKLSPAV